MVFNGCEERMTELFETAKKIIERSIGTTFNDISQYPVVRHVMQRLIYRLAHHADPRLTKLEFKAIRDYIPMEREPHWFVEWERDLMYELMKCKTQTERNELLEKNPYPIELSNKKEILL